MNQELFAELVLQSQAGDKDAMEQLLLQAYTPVSYLTNKILPNKTAAQQVARDVLETVLSNISSLQNPDQFEQWLCRMTGARCIQASPLLHRNFAESDAPAIWDDHLHNGIVLSEEESAEAIQSMVDCLPESQRLCILLLSCGELTVPSIAQLTGFSEASIKQNIKSGQKTIQQHLWELDSRGIRFSGLSSLTGILHDAMYHNPDNAAAMEMVYSILGKKMRTPLSVWIIRLLIAVASLLAVAVLALCGILVMKIKGSML